MREAAEGAGTSAGIRDATRCGTLLGRCAAYHATGCFPSTWIQERVSRWADLCLCLMRSGSGARFGSSIMENFQVNWSLDWYIYILWEDLDALVESFHSGIESYKCILDIVIGRRNWFLNLIRVVERFGRDRWLTMKVSRLKKRFLKIRDFYIWLAMLWEDLDVLV